MIFKDFMTDKVTLIKKDGTVYESVEAGVTGDNILIGDVSLPVEAGDEIRRALPSGLEEIFVVTDPGFQQKVFDFDAHYIVRYEKKGVGKPQPRPEGVTVHVSGGDNTRVNVNSVDQSVNVSSTEVGATFDQTRDLIREGVADAIERDRLLRQVDELQRAHGTSEFRQAYKEFMDLAANHVAVLVPVLAGLAALL